MLRLLALLAGVLCCTLILAEIVGIGFLWSKGYLTATNLYEVRLLLTGETRVEQDEQAEEVRAAAASRQEVQAAREKRVLDLESRGKELDLLKTMTTNTVNDLKTQRETFDEMKEAFRTELTRLNERHQQEAVEQARAVLLASPTEAAVERLMALPLDEAIDLVRGMPEKSIAKILQGFDTPSANRTQPNERPVRGQKIFEALSRGEPARTLIQDTASKLPPKAGDSPGGG